ncbi:hypothetical protein M758_4G204200 [Ceratodon purpureus]|nr:hypothetical protein M758_4G204200 [Ceratodon purpureus]
MALERGLFLLICCCWVLALMCCQPLTGASRLPTAYKRALQEFKSDKVQVIRAELIHRNHPESPLNALSGASAADRHAASASRHRAHVSRRLAAGVEFQAPVSSAVSYGETYGQPEYVMTLYLGTPVQKFVVIFDTGSDLVWVQCLPCSRPYQCYNETDPFFNPSSSSSYSVVPCTDLSCQLSSTVGCNSVRNCQISYAYGTPGSGIGGLLSTETISFSNNTDSGQLGISNFLFGCMDNDTSSFGTVDGLVGMGRGPLSLPSQLSQLTSFNVFSYCLVPYLVSFNLTSPLLFGASNSKGLKLVYTPIVDNPDIITYYWVNLTGISINGTAVNIPKAPLEWNLTTATGGTIFDSGTPNTIFSNDIWTPVVQTLKELITYPTVPAGNETLCYNVSGVQEPVYPSMSFQFSGVGGGVVDFPLTGQNLFSLNSTDDLTVQCLTIIPAGSQFLGPNIIGNFAQADHYIETDLVNTRIGWASRNCSQPL